MSTQDESIFDQALLQAGGGGWGVSYDGVFDGWMLYRDEYGSNPDTCRLTKQTLRDMYTDEVLRGMIVTEETIFMTPSVDPERNLALFEERVRDEAFGLIMGMEIVIDDEFNDHVALLHEDDYGITERSVVING